MTRYLDGDAESVAFLLDDSDDAFVAAQRVGS